MTAVIRVQCCGEPASKALLMIAPPAMTLQQLLIQQIQTQQTGLVQILCNNRNSFAHFQQQLSGTQPLRQDLMVCQLNSQQVLWIAYSHPQKHHPGVG